MKDKFKKFVRQHWIFIWALLNIGVQGVQTR